jgi:hypothetical protein
MELMQKNRQRRQMGVYWFAVEKQNGNSGWNECRKRSQQRQLAVYCRRRESKMEIQGILFRSQESEMEIPAK